jgi:hypothetical protein
MNIQSDEQTKCIMVHGILGKRLLYEIQSMESHKKNQDNYIWFHILLG